MLHHVPGLDAAIAEIKRVWPHLRLDPGALAAIDQAGRRAAR
jgi:hypothetical protein